MKIYFIRHGESEGNAQRIHQDAKSPLSIIGVSQAKLLAYRFKKIPIDVILSSDYVRAVQTAEEVAKVILKPIKKNPLLRERRGPKSIINKRIDSPKIIRIRQQISEHTDDVSWHYEDEENFFDLYDRSKKCLEYLSKVEEKNIAVVTHGFFLCMLMSTIFFEDDLTPELFRKIYHQLHHQNTGITICEFENDRWQLKTWNDHAHLG